MRTLDTLPRGETATIAALDEAGAVGAAMAEAGLTPGAEVEVLARGLVGGSPLSVRVGRAIVALRRGEARRVSLA